MTARRVSIDDYLAMTRAVAASYAPPGVLARRVRIELDDGGEIALPVSPVEPPPEAAQGQTLEQQIVELLAAEGRPLKGTVIAARLRRPYGSHVRETLAGMVGETLAKTEGGYTLAED